MRLELERLVLLEDPPLELAKLAARFDPELLDELRARVLERLEGVRLPTRAVEREHELRPQPLAKWVLAHKRLELSDERGGASELKVRRDAILERDDASLREARDLRLREVRVREVCERRPAPQRERLRERRGSGLGLGGLELSTAFVGEALEDRRVEGALVQDEAVAGSGRFDLALAERLAEAGDVDVDRLDRGARRVRSVERGDDAIGGHDPATLEGQDGQERLLLRTEREAPTIAFDLERTENSHLHSTCRKRL